MLPTKLRSERCANDLNHFQLKVPSGTFSIAEISRTLFWQGLTISYTPIAKFVPTSILTICSANWYPCQLVPFKCSFHRSDIINVVYLEH